ncbi:YceI family protein [Amycolatopsis antarctica]|uniref:YceI family protein n=1 Tax=Amycolatopsis antarctica TaxID=1854586 RepID=UPI001F0AEF63|nr:YceI family protein [Amycolatopsis antarctica]
MSSSTENATDRIDIPLAGRYVIDTGRSTVDFTTRHLFGLAPVRGSFSVRDGRITVTEPVFGSSVEAAVDATSFRTGNSARDKVVHSGRYLDTDRYPAITFSSIALKQSGTDWTLNGTLTVREVTRPVELAIRHAESGVDGLTVRADTRIDRTDFGLTAQKGMTGRYLDLTLHLAAVPAQ